MCPQASEPRGKTGSPLSSGRGFICCGGALPPRVRPWGLRYAVTGVYVLSRKCKNPARGRVCFLPCCRLSLGLRWQSSRERAGAIPYRNPNPTLLGSPQAYGFTLSAWARENYAPGLRYSPRQSITPTPKSRRHLMPNTSRMNSSRSS